jgi:hypothetical protein
MPCRNRRMDPLSRVEGDAVLDRGHGCGDRRSHGPDDATGLHHEARAMTRRIARHCALIPLLTTACALASCGGESATSPTTTATTTTPALVTETFSGSIGQNGTAVHSFTVTTSGYTLLAGYSSLAPSTVTALGIGLGSWDATNGSCGLNLTQNDSARSGSTAISGSANAGAYCLRVYDGANIGPGLTASYSVQVQHY